jgi:uncharacterized protein YeaO (DUF488 family)
MLKTKSMFAEISTKDGLRISVMSRHTLNDGVTPDARIIPNVSYNEHLVELAPPSRLVGMWYRKMINWEEFTHKYSTYLRRPEVSKSVMKLAEMALRQDVTILCVEPKGEDCHRVILAQNCKQLYPELKIEYL